MVYLSVVSASTDAETGSIKICHPGRSLSVTLGTYVPMIVTCAKQNGFHSGFTGMMEDTQRLQSRVSTCRSLATMGGPSHITIKDQRPSI